jgi:hypothetical protein
VCRTAPLFFILWGGLQASGQNSDSADQKTISGLIQQIKDLQQRDRKLQERIRALEAKQEESDQKNKEKDQKEAEQKAIGQTENDQKASAQKDGSGSQNGQGASSAPAPPTATAEIPAATPQSETTSTPPPETPELHIFRGIQWRGFGEVDYKVLNQRAAELGTYGFTPGSAGNFYTGDFDLFLASHLSEKTSVLAEIDFEEQDAQSFKVDLRRMLFKYDLNDHVRLSFGRNQTYIGYYNWAFRSASWLQTTADRPLVMEYATDGGILPTQAVGVFATGTIPSGKLGLNYVAEYGSSDTIRPDINGDGMLNDENNGNYANLGFFLTPDRFPGLRIGGSVYHDQISDLVSMPLGVTIGTQPSNSTYPPESERWNQTIVNGHVVYVSHGIEFLNECFLIRHAPIGGGEIFHTPAFYSQFSRKFGPLRPFVRYQYVNASLENPIYDDVGLRYGPSFGVRYDPNDYIALKAQVDRTARRGLPDLSGLHFQLSGTF